MKLYILILFFILPFICVSQKEANNWYFGEYAGITFETGSPIALPKSVMRFNFGTSSISDSLGNLLFYTDGEHVYNRIHEQMPRGSGLLGYSTSQTSIIVKLPGSSFEYLIFTVGCFNNTPNATLVGLHYSKVNMNLNGGLGDIDPLFKNIPLNISNVAIEKITAVRHVNNKDVWIVVRQLSQPVNQFHAYLVTAEGVNPAPTPSNCISNVPLNLSGNTTGQMKVSPDSKYIFSTINGVNGGCEIGLFNNTTGHVSMLFNFVPENLGINSWGVEYSQDSRFLYMTNFASGLSNRINQYDLSLLPDEDLFINSMEDIGQGGNATDLQSGPDGRIYVARNFKEFLGVIKYPGLKGTACTYDSLGVYLGGQKCFKGLPQFIQTYFLRFEYQGNCAGESFSFTPNFNPVPDSIHWDFGDPASGGNNTSTELNPEHVFSQGGEYTVTAFVRYPDGRTETANRQVTVNALPQPYPKTDTLICKGSSVILQAESGYTSYNWSTNQTSDFISVVDTGFYWVEAVNSQGCIGRDTVHVQWYPVPQLTADTVISPTTCGNSIGSIRGVNIYGGNPPYSVEWLNSQNNVVATTNDIYYLKVDNYYLWVTDGNGCRNLLASCDIQNIDRDYIIKNVIPDSTWCNQPKGSLEVEVQGGLSDRLLYTIDNWVTHQTTGVFTDLLPKSYFVMVKDSLNCDAVYPGNPVIIINQPGVKITGHTELPEIDNTANGSITIYAIGDSLSYSLNGLPGQTSGVFENLTSGPYTVTVTDKHDCDSTLYLEILPQTGHTLYATAGDTMVCNGLRASEPLLVTNFKDITSFEIALSYNNLLVDATGVINVNNEIASGLEPVNYPSAGMVKIKWTGTNALTLPDNTVLFYLAMQAKNPGISTVNWTLANNETRFVNKFGVVVPVKDSMGKVTIAPNPQIWGFYQKKVCEFDSFSQMALPSGGTGNIQVTWQTPTELSTGLEYKIDTARLVHSGLYRVTAIDEMNCMARDSVIVTVVPLPKANLPSEGDTLYFTPPYQLTATPGYYMYLWNTGENTNFINVTEDGEYSVIVKTEEGCADNSSVFLRNGTVVIKVPNAFTPNGDGLNDTFKPVVDLERVQLFTMTIYNKWGQLVYETNDLVKGWDGEKEPAGVYAWVINYSDRLGNFYQNKGSVVIVK